MVRCNMNGKCQKDGMNKMTDSAEYTDTVQYESAIGVNIHILCFKIYRSICNQNVHRV